MTIPDRTVPMAPVTRSRRDDTVAVGTSTADLDPGQGDHKASSRWHPGVLLILVLVVALPLLSTGILVGSKGFSGWTFREKAQAAAKDAARLQMVASARAQLNAVVVPVSAVSYASSIGVSETELDDALKPAVPFADQLDEGMARLAALPFFSSTPTLRADLVGLRTTISKITTDAISYNSVHTFVSKVAADVDSIWYQGYGRLQSDIAAWQPPGSFEVRASALRQTYVAFLAADNEVEGGVYVLEGTGPPGAKQELIQGAGRLQIATSEFVGYLGPKAQAVWSDLQHNAADKQFEATIQRGLTVALDDLPAPFLNNLQFAGSSERPGLQYVAAYNRLVVAASRDLQDSALAQASVASQHFVDEILLLGLLALVTVGGVVVASRLLTRPVKELTAAAGRVHDGEFDLERLPDRGPREVVTATASFNDMTSTLKALESKAVALAAEDFSHPELFIPLPGRTGHALQASVDTLTTRIRERELQRQLLHEAATHDRLTGLFNRAAVLDHLTNDVGRRRQGGETVAVLFVDIDGLKILNDTYGHEAGDTAILVTAQSLLEATSDCDVVGRLGGDEFLVVLCDEHSSDGEAVVDRIRRTVTGHSIAVQGLLIPLEVSVGIALAQCDAATDPMQLVREADEAMYGAKKAARALRDQSPAAQV
jgi:diguanylate cyclase (GGDEF)-like protein